MDEKNWFKKGLHFSCTECGKCCTGSPGYVWLSKEDITLASQALSISENEFIQKYTRKVHGKISLTEKKPFFDCVFLKEKKCLIYKARPKQCRTYPFWPNIMKNRSSWEEEKKYCEGIEHPDAKLIDAETIQSHLKN